MGRLVVAGILECNLCPVGWIVHERVDAALGHVCCRVDAQVRVGRVAVDDFLAPIAKEICGQRRGGLGPIVRRAAARVQQGFASVLGDGRAVLKLAPFVGVPIDDEVASRRGGRRNGRVTGSTRGQMFVAG